MSISGNDEQPANAFFPIECIDDEIEILFKDEQPLKAFSPIEVTEEGISICVNDEHL